VHDDLLELERGFWGAAGDPDFYRRRFADAGRCVFGFGTLDKDATVASMASATPWTEVDLHEVAIVPLGAAAAALTYRARATRGDEPYEAMVSSVYVRGDDGWQLAVHHQTPVT
jgi:hypothetical protein